MSIAVIKDKDQFNTFLAAQPLCKWSLQKQQEIAMGMHGNGHFAVHPAPAKKNDNAELAAALASMA